jgi:ribosome-associated translation inhibitor RaiA
METPIHIDFEGCKPIDKVRDAIEKHVDELETRFGRFTACRIGFKAPSSHHQTGGLYEVKIHLSLPNGREVDISRTPTGDERHANMDFAVNDAFKHARKLLQDQVRRIQGKVKHHADHRSES